MSDLAGELTGSAALYPQKYDSGPDAIYFLRLSEAAYRAASFLDDRMLRPGMTGAWIPYAQIESLVGTPGSSLPLHFIFHAGHVGSTLLSRLLDETQLVLGLREPLPLRTLASAYDELRANADAGAAVKCARRLESFLTLWSRGFPSNKAVVLKSTSTASRLAPRLLEARPGARAVYLNLSAESYLATLLAGANAMTDLRGFGGERIERLRRMLGGQDLSLDALSVGELAAMSWLTERLTQNAILDAFGSRVLAIDFDAMLRGLEATLERVLAHFAFEPPPFYLENLARSPVLTRYSKAPEQFAYSPAMRAQILAQARADHAGELRKGMNLLNQLGNEHVSVASVLS